VKIQIKYRSSASKGIKEPKKLGYDIVPFLMGCRGKSTA
jgi:hypothetical protein